MTAETATTDTNTPELEVKNPAALLAKNLELLRERIEALQSEKESLHAALVKESIRAANEKLRAEKMALQHRMQADMHISACKELARLRAAAPKPSSQAQDAERYHWLRDNRNWQVLHRIRPGKSIEYRMRDDGDWWGSWWPTHEQAIDAARAVESEVQKQDEALIRLMLEALECSGEPDDPGHRCSHCDDYVDRNSVLRNAARARLESKP